MIDSALGGTLSKSISGTTTSLSGTDVQNTGFVFTGSLSAANAITWSAFSGMAAITNNTTGGFTITCGISGGTYATILSGESAVVWSDGTNFTRMVQPIYPGEMKPYAGTSAPTGYLFCDGSAVSRTTYAALFNQIGSTFGSGNGTTTFNIPDMRGRVPAGYDASNTAGRLTGSTSQGVSASTLGNTGGEQAHTLTTAELASHNHGVSDSGHVHAAAGADSFVTTDGSQVNITGGGGTHSFVGTGDPTNTQTATTGISINNAGSGSAHNVVQPTLIVGWIIKT